MRTLNQKGVGHLLIVLALLVVATIGFVGWKVLGSDDTGTASVSTSEQVAVPATIKDKSDLNQASQALDTTDIDSGVNPDSLNSDLNSL